VKLDLKEFKTWIDSELNGYEGMEIPRYRILKGELKAFDPYRGLISAVFPDNNFAELCTTKKLYQKISEIEILAKGSKDKERLFIPFSDQEQILLRQFFKTDMEFKLIFPPTILSGILDSVRNVILDWSLKLEQNGIIGEGMTFSKEDKAKAHAAGVTYQIGSIENFTGTMGSVADQAVVNASTTIGLDVTGLTSLIEQLKLHQGQLGLANDKQNELNEKLVEIEIAVKNPKPEVSRIGILLGSMRTIIQGAASSLLVHGALFEIDKYKHLIPFS